MSELIDTVRRAYWRNTLDLQIRASKSGGHVVQKVVKDGEKYADSQIAENKGHLPGSMGAEVPILGVRSFRFNAGRLALAASRIKVGVDESQPMASEKDLVELADEVMHIGNASEPFGVLLKPGIAATAHLSQYALTIGWEGVATYIREGIADPQRSHYDNRYYERILQLRGENQHGLAEVAKLEYFAREWYASDTRLTGL